MRLLPTRVHGVIDCLTGLSLIASPRLFRLAGLVWAPDLLIAFFEIVASLAMRTHPSFGPSSGMMA